MQNPTHKSRNSCLLILLLLLLKDLSLLIQRFMKPGLVSTEHPLCFRWKGYKNVAPGMLLYLTCSDIIGGNRVKHTEGNAVIVHLSYDILNRLSNVMHVIDILGELFQIPAVN
jgi:hypothetical protein